MKKQLTGIVLGLACAASLSFGAFAEAPTAEDILAASSEAGSVNEMNFTVDGAADIAIVLPDMGDEGTFAVNGSLGMDASATLEPLAMKMDMNMSGEAVGQSGDIDMQMYMVTKEDGALGMYMKGVALGEEMDWQYAEIPAEEISSFISTIKEKGGQFDMSSFPVEFALADDTVDVNGHECYQLTTSMTWAELKEVVTTALDAAKAELPEEQAESFEQIDQALGMADMFVGGLVLNMEIDVDTQSYLPQRAHLDLAGSDWTVLAALFAQSAGLTNEDGSLMNVDINVNSLYLDYIYDYETPVDVTVPEEAIAAEANGVTLDEDALADAGELLG